MLSAESDDFPSASFPTTCRFRFFAVPTEGSGGSANHDTCLALLSTMGYRNFELLRDGAADGMYEVLARG